MIQIIKSTSVRMLDAWIELVLLDTCICLISSDEERCSPVDIDSISVWSVENHYRTKVDVFLLFIKSRLSSLSCTSKVFWRNTATSVKFPDFLCLFCREARCMGFIDFFSLLAFVVLQRERLFDFVERHATAVYRRIFFVFFFLHCQAKYWLWLHIHHNRCALYPGRNLLETCAHTSSNTHTYIYILYICAWKSWFGRKGKCYVCLLTFNYPNGRDCIHYQPSVRVDGGTLGMTCIRRQWEMRFILSIVFFWWSE